MLTFKPPCPLLPSEGTDTQGVGGGSLLQSPTSPSTSPGREMSEKLRVYTKSPVPCVLGWWLLMSRQTLHQVENHEDLHAGKTSPRPPFLGTRCSAPESVCVHPPPPTPGEAQTQISPAHDLLGAAAPSSTPNLG
uniref:Uncharacterized protein n=1 Tax=Macaca nemestrina TaxID=9545 RepID=A0A2K6E9M3_MACNE